MTNYNDILEKEYEFRIIEDFDKSNLDEDAIKYVESIFYNIKFEIPFIEKSRAAMDREYKKLERDEITFADLTEYEYLISSDKKIQFEIIDLTMFCKKNNIDSRMFIERYNNRNKDNNKNGVTTRQSRGFTVIENHNPTKPNKSKHNPNEGTLPR